ncbi:MAG: tetratricopeptide repeat protein [Acidobacteriia bacterium]|nr:tetratricopeptide repeat protein [Terriglobia bacterium]
MCRVFGLLLGVLLPACLPASQRVRAVLVFPFENQSARPDLNWISESFAEILSSRLSGPENYVLDRSERNAAYQQLGIPADSPLTLASEYTVARTLGVDWAVIGNFSVIDNNLVARARLLEVQQLMLSQPMEASGALSDLVDLQTLLAWRLLGTHDPSFTVGTEEDFRRRFPEVRLDAFENYTRGVLSTDDESRIHFFTESDRLNPADHQAAFELGRLYFDQKDYADSLKWLAKLQDGDTHYFEGLFLRAVDEFFLGRQQDSEQNFALLAREIPLNEVWNDLGVLQAGRGQYAEALGSFERAYKGDPTDPDFAFNLGVCFWYLKRYTEAEQYLNKDLRENEDDSEAHTLLAAVLGRLQDSGGQHRELQWLAQHEGDSTTDAPGDILPQARLKKNYDGRAFRLLTLTVHNALEESLSKLSPAEHHDVHVARGKKFFAEGRSAEAERELGEAVSLVPTDAAAHVLMARVLEAEGKHAEAAAELEAALKLQNSASAHILLARVYLELHKPDLARGQGQAALALEPGNQEALQLLNVIHPTSSHEAP